MGRQVTGQSTRTLVECIGRTVIRLMLAAVFLASIALITPFELVEPDFENALAFFYVVAALGCFALFASRIGETPLFRFVFAAWMIGVLLGIIAAYSWAEFSIDHPSRNSGRYDPLVFVAKTNLVHRTLQATVPICGIGVVSVGLFIRYVRKRTGKGISPRTGKGISPISRKTSTDE
jgi:hypothetical protein